MHEVPEASRSAAGTAIVKLISVPRGSDVAALLGVRDFGEAPPKGKGGGTATATGTEDEEEEEEEEVEESDGEGEGVAPAPAGAPPSSSSPQPDLLLLTRNGLVKRTALSQFAKVRSNGTYAIKLRAGAGDELVWVARRRPTALHGTTLMSRRRYEGGSMRAPPPPRRWSQTECSLPRRCRPQRTLAARWRRWPGRWCQPSRRPT